MLAERERLQRAAEDRKSRRDAAANSAAELAEAQRVKTPPALHGRKHFVTQTEVAFLEEITDIPLEVDANCQTDIELEKTPAPHFVPIPRGIETGTQIEDGELFDFEREIEPILEGIVGSAIDTAQLELARESEIAAIKAAQDVFTSRRDAELAEVARLEGEVRRRQEERARRIEQEKERKAAEEAVQRKVSAAAFARTFIASLRRSTLAQLAEAGHFYDPMRREIEAAVLPGLMMAVEGSTSLRQQVAAVMVDELVGMALRRAIEPTVASALQSQMQLGQSELLAAVIPSAQRAQPSLQLQAISNLASEVTQPPAGSPSMESPDRAGVDISTQGGSTQLEATSAESALDDSSLHAKTFTELPAPEGLPEAKEDNDQSDIINPTAPSIDPATEQDSTEQVADEQGSDTAAGDSAGAPPAGLSDETAETGLDADGSG